MLSRRLTDELSAEYIDSEAFTICQPEKEVGAKKMYYVDVITAQRNGYRRRNVKMINKVGQIDRTDRER